MHSDVRHAQLIANLCALASALMLLVLMASATLRMGHNACADLAYPATFSAFARVIHRVSATSVGLLFVVIAFFVLRCRPVVRGRVVLLAVLFVLTLFLAVLGRLTSGNLTPAVVIGNVVAGMTLMALFWRLRLEFLPRESYQRPNKRLSMLSTSARSLTALQIWLGSWVAGLVVAIDCKSSPMNSAPAWWPDAAAWSALNPFHLPAASGQALSQALNWLSVVHEFSAVLVLIAVTMFCISLQRSGAGLRRAAPALLVLIAIQAALGIITIFGGKILWIGVMHNAIAALLFVKLIDIRYRLHRS